MADSTVNREVKGFNVRTLNEKYLNFSEFNGLCDNKNYLGIDQNTFTDVNNLYVDQDLQLSSRPPTKRINFLNPDEFVIKVYRVNNLSIYHTRKEDTYWIHFEYKDTWYSREVTERINVMWLDSRYAIFTESNIIGFDYNYDTKELNWYEAEDMIYVPVTEIIHNGVKTEHESMNVFTDSKSVRYTFDGTSAFDVETNKELLGKNLTINIGEESFYITWQLNNEKVFTTNIGNTSASLVQVASNGTMLGCTMTELYYSFDGSLFYTLKESPKTEFINPIFAEDGSAVWVLQRIDDSNAKLHVMSLTSVTTPSDLNSLTWASYDFSLPTTDVRYVINYSSANIYTDSRFTFRGFDVNVGEFSPFGHSPESGKFVAMVPIRNTYTDKGNPTKTTIHECSALVVFTDNSVKIYPQDERIRTVTYGAGTNMWNTIVNKIRLLPPNMNRPTALIAVSHVIHDTWRKRAIIALNSSYVPYHRYSFSASFIWKDYYMYSAEVSNTHLSSSFYGHELAFLSTGADVSLKSVYAQNTTKADILYTADVDIGSVKLNWPNEYTDSAIGDFKLDKPIEITLNNTQSTTIGTFVNNPQYKLDAVNNNVLTDRYFRYNGTNILLLKRGSGSNTPLYISGDTIIYRSSVGNIYRNGYPGLVSTDINTVGSNTYILPDHIATFVSNVLSDDNKVYIASKRDGKLYVPKLDVLSFSSEITALVNFTQTSLGIFLEDEVHELLYNADNDLYILSRTKLQLGCKMGAELLLNYDGKTIFITTLKGLTALDYQDFVQSTEQVYSYLTENIMTSYDKYSSAPLKLSQFKNWIFMYRTDLNYLYVFDLRNKSWWKWTNVNNVQQIVFDGDNLLILMNGVPYAYDFNFDGDNYYDEVGIPIEWMCKSQRLHFNAPNNYKQIKSFSIMTSQEEESILRCKLQLKCFHNIHNTTDTDVVEYELDQMTTAIYKVNFFKLNAFQFVISSDKTEKKRREFVTPNISIKHRVTERIR